MPQVQQIHTKPKVTSVIIHERQVSKSFHNKLQVRLVRMIKLDVIEPVTEPTECLSTSVTIKQLSKSLRVCFNSKDLKKQSKDSISNYLKQRIYSPI